ncbi:MAG: FliG C-terminal domain-containing protein [Bacillota bacterium]
MIHLFGEKHAEVAEKELGIRSLDRQTAVERLCKMMKTESTQSPISGQFESSLAKLDRRSMQRLLREIDIMELGLAIKGIGEKLSSNIIDNLSVYGINILVEILQMFDADASAARIVNAQGSILEIIKKLRIEGDIV